VGCNIIQGGGKFYVVVSGGRRTSGPTVSNRKRKSEVREEAGRPREAQKEGKKKGKPSNPTLKVIGGF